MSSGGDGILTITGYGRFEKLHSDLQRTIQENVKLQEQLRKVTQESKKADKSQEEMLDGLMGKVTKMATAWLSVQSAISLAAAAHEDYKQKANDAADISLKVAAAQRELAFNLGPGAKDADRNQITDLARRLGRDLGIGQADANIALSRVTGAIRDPRPAVRLQVGADTVAIAGKYYPGMGNGEKIGDLGVAIQNVQNAVPGMTLEQATETVQAQLSASQLKNVSNITDLTRGANAAASSRRDVTDKYLNYIQTNAIAGSFTQTLGDQEGRLAATATANYVAAFEKATKGKYKHLPILDAVDLASKEMPGFADAMEDALQGEAVTKGAQRDLFLKGFTETNARAIQGEFGKTPEQIDAMFQWAVNGTPEQRRSRALNMSSAANEQVLSDRFGDAGTIRRVLFGGGENDKGYYGVHSGFLHRKLLEMDFTANEWMGIDPKATALEYLSEDIRAVRNVLKAGGLSQEERQAYERRIEDAERRSSEISSLGQVIQDNTNMVSNGQNAQAATAQRHAHVE
jgi:hypothetical protein